MATNNPEEEEEGILSRLSKSPIVRRSKSAAYNTGYVVAKILWNTVKAGWYGGTFLFVLAIPLFVVMELNELEAKQQAAKPPQPSSSN